MPQPRHMPVSQDWRDAGWPPSVYNAMLLCLASAVGWLPMIRVETLPPTGALACILGTVQAGPEPPLPTVLVTLRIGEFNHLIVTGTSGHAEKKPNPVTY